VRPLTRWLPHLVTDEHAPALGETASATFSPDRAYRYALTRSWDTDRPVACFIMLNPSTADAFAEDPTIRRCIRFARSWRAGGLLVLNLFALRSTSPRALYSHEDPVGPDNDAVLRWVFSPGQELVGPVVAAWGVHGALMGRGSDVTAMLGAGHIELTCLGVTKDRQPRHPLYVPGATAVVPFPVVPSVAGGAA